MTRVTNEIRIDAPREKVWNVIAELGSVSVWNPFLADSRYTSEAKEGLEAAQATFHELTGRADAGEVTQRELLDAERELRAAQRVLIGAYVSTKIARAAVDRARGWLANDAFEEPAP